jgi:predicted secreted protein
MKKTALVPLLCATALLMPLVMSLTTAPAQAQTHKQSDESNQTGILSLDAQASVDVPQDVIHITLFYEQQGNDAAQLADALNQRTAQTLRDANATDHTGVTLHTGQLSVAPSTDRDGKISAWRGRSELVLESHDFAAAAKLAGRLNSEMQVSNVNFSLSPEAQRAAQGKLSGEAIAGFRQQAQAAAQAFGYSAYVVREVTLSRNNNNFPRPMMMMARSVANGAPGESIPVEAGNETVTVTVSGSIVMTH